MVERGTYENPKRGRQLLRFDGMRYPDSITPTDIDAFIEFKNKILVFFEAKLKNKDVPYGQRLALERLVQNATQAGKHAIAIICEHDVEDAQEDVFLKDLRVREVFHSETQKWHPPKRPMKAKDVADMYIQFYYSLEA